MKAAIVHAFDQVPRYGDIAAPAPQSDEILVSTRAAAISQLVRAQASGKHYSSGKILPMVPGADGVGRLADGRRVYFAFPRSPIGSMAQTVAVRSNQCVVIPDDVDDITAAAIANPGMSSWAALEYRARFRQGESVLVLGAAGTSGRLAIQIAKHMGASHVIAAARDPATEHELRSLGADDFIRLDHPPETLTSLFRQKIHAPGVDVVLDYLWGMPAECFLSAASTHGGGEAAPRIRYVNIGAMAGASIAVPAGQLRGSGLELMGSGLGSVSNEDLIQAIGQLLRIVRSEHLSIDAVPVALSEVESAWGRASSERIVLTL